jgi:hypothetical protein
LRDGRVGGQRYVGWLDIALMATVAAIDPEQLVLTGEIVERDCAGRTGHGSLYYALVRCFTPEG